MRHGRCCRNCRPEAKQGRHCYQVQFACWCGPSCEFPLALRQGNFDHRTFPLDFRFSCQNVATRPPRLQLQTTLTSIRPAIPTLAPGSIRRTVPTPASIVPYHETADGRLRHGDHSGDWCMRSVTKCGVLRRQVGGLTGVKGLLWLSHKMPYLCLQPSSLPPPRSTSSARASKDVLESSRDSVLCFLPWLLKMTSGSSLDTSSQTPTRHALYQSFSAIIIPESCCNDEDQDGGQFFIPVDSSHMSAFHPAI